MTEWKSDGWKRKRNRNRINEIKKSRSNGNYFESFVQETQKTGIRLTGNKNSYRKLMKEGIGLKFSGMTLHIKALETFKL